MTHHHHAGTEEWTEATWPFVSGSLPPPPARVVEVGCGPEGGFVPRLLRAGYDAVGVDPEAPDERPYRRTTFEAFDTGEPLGAVLACSSLHHVEDLPAVLAKVERSLAPDGVLVLVEWDWPRFDEPTARWALGRLPDQPVGDDSTWLHRRRDDWAASGQGWDAWLTAWASEAGLHTGAAMIEALDAQLDRVCLDRTPYLFRDLEGTSREDEEAAIASGEVQPNGLHYVGRRRGRSGPG